MTEPTPADQYAGASEHEIQAALIEWVDYRANAVPELRLLFAIPNGGDRHPAVAAKMSAEGVRRGVPDLLLPVWRYSKGDSEPYSGLFIEMKTPKGRVRKEQREWHDALRQQMFKVVVCRGFDEAKKAIEDYLEGV